MAHYNGTNWSSMTSGKTFAIWGGWASGPNDLYCVDDGGSVLHYPGRWLGDIDRDGEVDVTDLLVLASSFGCSSGELGFNAACDKNNDRSVDVIDLLYFAQDFGK